MSERVEETDLRMCQEYLAQHPVPSVISMEEFVPVDGHELWHAFLADTWRHKLNILKQAGATDIEGLPIVPLKQLFVDRIDQAIEIEGKVISMSEPSPFTEYTTYLCLECDAEYRVPAGEGGRPRRCTSCGKRRFAETNFTVADVVDSQVVKIQEIRGLVGSSNHQLVSISTIVKGREMMWTAHAGHKVRQRGIYHVEPYHTSDGRELWRKHISVFSMQVLGNTDITLTPADIERIKQLSNEPQFYEKVIASFAPHLYGIDEAKEGCVLALASQGLDRPLNLLLAGDPDTGKSELMIYAVDLSHNGYKTDMASTSHVGLTVESAYDEDTKRRMAVPGMLNFADGGMAGIDELQAINATDAKKLNGVLEAKEIASDKAGVHEHFPARCALIVTSNSEFGRWDAATNILENLKFLGAARAAIVSRFDLIFIIKDIKNAEMDERKADKIIRTYGKAETPKSLFLQDTEESFGFYTMQKIFAYVAHQPLPDVPEELNQQFKNQYLSARGEDFNSMVGNRYFKSIIRLARIIARLLLKPVVTIEDLTRAKRLIDTSNNAAAFDPRTNQTDVQIIDGSSKPKYEVQRELNQDQQFWAAYDVAIKEHDGRYATLQDLKYFLQLNHKWTEDKTESYVKRVLKDARLYEPHGQGKYTRFVQS